MLVHTKNKTAINAPYLSSEVKENQTQRSFFHPTLQVSTYCIQAIKAAFSTFSGWQTALCENCLEKEDQAFFI